MSPMRIQPILLVAAVVAVTACSKSSDGGASATAAAASSSGTVVASASASAMASAAPSGSASSAPTGPEIEITSKAMLKEYEENEVRADVKFKGKRIRLTGIVGEIKKDITDGIYVTLGTGAELEIPVAQCFFSDEHTKETAALVRKRTVSVDCTCGGLMGNVIMRDCAFVPNGAMDACKKLEAAGVALNCLVSGVGRATFGYKGSRTGGIIAQLATDKLFEEHMKVRDKLTSKDVPNLYTSARARLYVVWMTDAPKDTDPKIKAVIDAL